KLHPGIAVFAGSLTISILLLPADTIPELIVRTLLGHQFLRLLVIVASALTLSRLMELKGLLTRLAATMESIGPRLAMHLVPAIIGLVPMPGGALVSAAALKDLVRRMRLAPEQATFINYWFRHIWELSLPVYPSIITASVILSVPLSSLFLILLPLTAVAIALGSVSSYRILRLKNTTGTREKATRSIAADLLRAAWPVLLLVLLVSLGVDAVIAFPVALGLCALQQRARWPEMKQALKFGLAPKILLLLYAVMLYKATIEISGAAYTLLADMETIRMPTLAILVVLPLLIGFATGLSLPFVGISFPLLLPFMTSGSEVSSYAILLAYASGAVGYLLSPLHLCLILTTEYFKAPLGMVYRYLLPPLVALGAIIVAVYCIGV
ncbi:MAG: DUF401 family protein, partial [Dehalococcoidia bacterium]|nr:DUF401 family protein [Dehalococcoidia bacterium]